jgi:hypothetical protein
MSLKVVAAFLAGIAVAVPMSAIGAGKHTGYNIYPGQVATFVGLDWTCAYLIANGGRPMLCGRESTINGVNVVVTGASVKVWQTNHHSGQNCCKTLLYSHVRNP